MRPSVRLSARLMYRAVGVRWVSLKVITRIISLVSSHVGATTSAIYPGEHPQNSGGIGVWSLFSAENLQYLRNGAKQDQGY